MYSSRQQSSGTQSLHIILVIKTIKQQLQYIQSHLPIPKCTNANLSLKAVQLTSAANRTDFEEQFWEAQTNDVVLQFTAE